MIKKLLLILFGFLAFIPFVFADYVDGMNGLYEFNVNSATELGNFTYQFDYKGNLATFDSLNHGNFVFNIFNNNPYTLWNSYSRYNGNLYYYSKSSYNGNTTQGFLDKWCIKENLSDCYNGNYAWDTEDVIATIGRISKVVYGAGINGLGRGNLAGANNPTMLCFYDGTYYCVSCSHSTDCKSGLTGTSLNLNADSITSLNDISWSDSPFVGFSNKPSYEIGENYYTNGQIVEGYEYLGLDIGYCYGGFPIDDIFEPNQTIDDFTGYEFGVGATVWDLYDLYSGAYSTPKQFFQQMLQAYMNGQINRFKTEPKALIMFVQQFVSGRDRGRLNVGFYDIWDYCNLKFDNVDLNAQYTGNNKTPINGYNQKKVSDSNLGGFQFTGDNAFNIIVGTGGTGDISASEFFGNLTSRFQNGLGTVNTNYVGMIPTYILMFMFALIFIRLISH